MNERAESPSPATGVEVVELVELDEGTCMDLLDTTPVGRLAFIGEDSRPTILPVNHVVDEGDIYFRTAPGTKLDVAQRLATAPVAFEVDDFTTSERTGWSVHVRGRIEPVADAVRRAHLDRTGHKAWVSETDQHAWVRVIVDEMTGRRLQPAAAD